ncbi:MAG: Fpg/Nei family DNA glycosylase [Nocardioides sp.]|nr:Fpg/Nei family DNA glycosylase [Nocardioides sp.]
MPEGHSIHRLARRHHQLFRGEALRAASPQGRFAEGAELLDGATLERTDAWGKHLFHHYTGDLRLHVHLGLYGTFTEGDLPAPHPRGALRLRLVGKERWLDLRGPIACEVLTPEQCRQVTDALGPDPLREGSDPALVLARLARSRASVGSLLMNQQVVAGVGNVYRAEILFRHGVSPFLPGRDLEESTWLSMWADLSVLMRAGVRTGRIVTTDPEDRARPAGRARRVDAHYVYRRTGQPCRRCDTPVSQVEMAARNLFWCSWCQPDP